MIDDFTIQRIKDAANIVDVMEELGFDLKKRGNAYECLCPFHDDRHIGSFKVSATKNVATCFSCGWSGGPIDFLMEQEHLSYPDALRWLGKKYSIEVEGSENFEVKPSVPRPQLPPLPMLVLPQWMVDSRQTSPTATLVNWLITSIAWDDCQLSRLFDYLIDYHVGESKDGRTIWWQIDEQQRVRTGKLMRYKPDGHRDKESNPTWIHSMLYQDPRTGYSADATEMKQTLFGMHLLDKYRRGRQVQDVCIVESEKTALLMATAYGNHAGQVWMACGGKNNINPEKLKPIIDQGRPIRLYPDRDAIQQWQLAAERLRYKKVIVDTSLVTKHWKEEDGPKADCGDVIVRITNDSKHLPKPLSRLIMENPRLRVLIEKLKLQPKQ